MVEPPPQPAAWDSGADRLSRVADMLSNAVALLNEAIVEARGEINEAIEDARGAADGGANGDAVDQLNAAINEARGDLNDATGKPRGEKGHEDEHITPSSPQRDD